MLLKNELFSDSEEKQKLTPDQKWEKATIANNFIFYKVMHNNPDICKELLEILLQVKIDHIDMKQEEQIAVDYDKKAVRLDIYAVGNTKAYSLEMQTSDTGELPERSRYYQGIQDVSELNSGELYRELKDGYIIFICIPDIFGKGLAKYTFENLCVEDPKIKLNDRTYKYFFIASNYDKILDEKQKAFLKLVINNESTSDFADRVSKLVKDAKHNTQWRKQFMDLEIEKKYAYREGEAYGAQKQAINTAINLLKMNIATPEQIAQAEEIPLEKVLELKEQLTMQTK